MCAALCQASCCDLIWWSRCRDYPIVTDQHIEAQGGRGVRWASRRQWHPQTPAVWLPRPAVSGCAACLEWWPSPSGTSNPERCAHAYGKGGRRVLWVEGHELAGWCPEGAKPLPYAVCEFCGRQTGFVCLSIGNLHRAQRVPANGNGVISCLAQNAFL